MVDDGFGRSGDEVGYRHPPRSGRFRKGESGNPAGRPKGSKNKPRTQGERLRALMLEEAYRPVTVGAEGQEATMSMAQAVVRSLAEAAAKGDARAQAMFFRLVNASEVEEDIAYDQMLADEEAAHPREIEIMIVDPDGTRTPYRPEGDASAKSGRPPGKS